MALSASRMKTAMKAALDAINASGGAITNDAGLDAICTAVIDEIQNNFVVSTFDTHTHDVTYIGAGTASSSQVATTEVP